MPLGILPDHKLERVPGTSPLSEVGRQSHGDGGGAHMVDGVDARLLKHDPTGRIVLVPQPSDSPNDPYNWPRWKKELFTVAIAFGCGTVGAIGPLLSPAMVPLSKQFNVPLQTFTTGVQGSCVAGIGAGSLVCNPLAVKFGRRPVYLATTLGLVVSSFWAAEATSFASLAAARAVQGVCMVPLEVLVPASIGDVWFVHERGLRMAIYSMAILGGVNLSPPIAGFIIQHGSLRIAFHAIAGAWILQLLLTFFFMPETAYHRTGTINLDTGDAPITTEHSADASDNTTQPDHHHKEEMQQTDTPPPTSPLPVPSPSSSSDPPTPYLHTILPYSGFYDPVPFSRILLQPFLMLASPPMIWATVLFTTCVSWSILLSITVSQIFSGPPYHFSVQAVGETKFSPLVAVTLGAVMGGPLLDASARVMARYNGGIFEPEFRLPIMFLAYISLTAPGFFGWGESLSRHEAWPVPVVVCLGLINLGIQLAVTSVMTYVVDCHRRRAAEAMGSMNFVRNMFALGLSFFVNDWIETQGVRNVFFTIGGITIGASLLTVPMYVFGKRARSFAARCVPGVN